VWVCLWMCHVICEYLTISNCTNNDILLLALGRCRCVKRLTGISGPTAMKWLVLLIFSYLNERGVFQEWLLTEISPRGPHTNNVIMTSVFDFFHSNSGLS